MAPIKRKTKTKAASDNDEMMTRRVTRSSTRVADVVVVDQTPKVKKAKVTFKDTPEIKTTTTQASKTIVIEHCKQCNQFKVRAVKVKLGLENALSGITVLVNPEKPRRGCFEVREEGGMKFVSLLDMKRPFAPMKALDMDALISDIIEQIQ